MSTLHDKYGIGTESEVTPVAEVNAQNSTLEKVLDVVYNNNLTYIQARTVLHQAMKALSKSRISPYEGGADNDDHQV